MAETKPSQRQGGEREREARSEMLGEAGADERDAEKGSIRDDVRDIKANNAKDADKKGVRSIDRDVEQGEL